MSERSFRFWLEGRWWQAYRPAMARVVGTYPELARDEDGQPEPTPVHLACEACGETHRVVCTSGNVRAKVAAFARAHVHVDPLGLAQLKRTGR